MSFYYDHHRIRCARVSWLQLFLNFCPTLLPHSRISTPVSDFSVHLRHLGLGPELWRDRQLLWSFEKFNWLLNFSDKLEILFLTEFHHCYHKLHVFAPALLHHAMAVNSQDLFTSAFENFTRITIITLLVKSFELAPPQESTALSSHTCDMFDTRGWDIFQTFKNSYSSMHSWY